MSILGLSTHFVRAEWAVQVHLLPVNTEMTFSCYLQLSTNNFSSSRLCQPCLGGAESTGSFLPLWSWRCRGAQPSLPMVWGQDTDGSMGKEGGIALTESSRWRHMALDSVSLKPDPVWSREQQCTARAIPPRHNVRLHLSPVIPARKEITSEMTSLNLSKSTLGKTSISRKTTWQLCWNYLW